MEIFQFVMGVIVGFITIITALWSLLKFMLKDVKKEVEILQNSQNDFKEELRIINKKLDEDIRAVSNRFESTNSRLDHLYRILLDKTYGNNIPNDLKISTDP